MGGTKAVQGGKTRLQFFAQMLKLDTLSCFFHSMNPFWKSYQKKLGEGLAQITLWILAVILLIGSGLVPSSNLQIKIPLIGVGCVLLLFAVVGLIGVLVRVFSSNKEVQPADICPYCRRATGQLINHLPTGNLTRDWAGREAYIFKCSNPNCGKNYGKQVKPVA
jgi:hypothetical protein